MAVVDDRSLTEGEGGNERSRLLRTGGAAKILFDGIVMWLGT